MPNFVEGVSLNEHPVTLHTLTSSPSRSQPNGLYDDQRTKDGQRHCKSTEEPE